MPWVDDVQECSKPKEHHFRALMELALMTIFSKVFSLGFHLFRDVSRYEISEDCGK